MNFIITLDIFTKGVFLQHEQKRLQAGRTGSKIKRSNVLNTKDGEKSEMTKKKKNQNYQELAMATGMHYDEANGVLHGKRDGFDFLLYPVDDSHPFVMELHTAAKSADGSTLDKETINQFCKNKNVITTNLTQKNLNIISHMGIQHSLEKMKNAANGSMNEMVNFLRNNAYSPCCDVCGQNVETAAVKTGGEYHHMCSDCETNLRSNFAMKAQQATQKNENIVGGIVGALLGSLLGALCILVLSQLGYVAALSGAIMAVCVLKGYEMLGGKLTKKAIVISVIIMILMTYFADRMDWALILFREGGGGEAGYNIFECYRLVSYALAAEIIDLTSYVGNLILLYAFVALGAVPAIRSKLKEKKEEGTMIRLN